MTPRRFWPRRPCLAGGIDKDGRRAVELLALGFGGVEFGTVTPRPQPGRNVGVAALAARLAALGSARPRGVLVGIGIGLGDDCSITRLAAEWVAGLGMAWDVADYLSFNLSAKAYRPLLEAGNRPIVLDAIASVAAARARLTAVNGRHLPLTLKLPLPLGDAALPDAAADAGFDALTLVLPAGAEGLDGLQSLAARLIGGPLLVAVGGIRTAADVRAVLAAGAAGVQVHTAFAEAGAACLPPLLAGFAAPEIHEGDFPNRRMPAAGSDAILAP